jgi:tetratricopeptide (TPR) repeat protein
MMLPERVAICAGALLLAMCGTANAQQPSHWMEDGAVALRQGDPKLAEEDFRHELEAAPNSADAYLGVGLAQLREGKLEESEASLAKASELNPSILSAHMFRGIALFQMNSLEPAAKELHEELKLQPKSAEALTWLGIIELQAGEPKLAAAALDEAGTLKTADASLLYYQVRAHTLAAQEAFRALFKMDGDSAYVHRAQAEIYSESQQPDKAIAEYELALKKSPKDPELYEALGNEEQRVSHIAEARSAYQSELALVPHNPIALFNLGKIEVETGDAGRGVELLQQAMDAHASAAPTCFYLGFGLSKLGRYQEAAGWLERSLASSASDPIRQRDYFELVRVYQRLGRKADSQRALEELKRLKAVPAAASQ